MLDLDGKGEGRGEVGGGGGQKVRKSKDSLDSLNLNSEFECSVEAGGEVLLNVLRCQLTY